MAVCFSMDMGGQEGARTAPLIRKKEKTRRSHGYHPLPKSYSNHTNFSGDLQDNFGVFVALYKIGAKNGGGIGKTASGDHWRADYI